MSHYHTENIKYSKLLGSYSLASFNSTELVDQYATAHNIKSLCRELNYDSIEPKNNDLHKTVSSNEDKPCKLELNDLCRLHWLTLSRKSINILELGSGFSTVVFADAMKTLSSLFLPWAQENVRCDHPFHVYSVDEDQRFLDITMKRLEASCLSNFATINRSSVDIILHENRIATIYSSLPNISPDLIYLDGPSQYGTTQSIGGISFNNQCRMPMSADILRIEYFLEPGTLIIVDGRTQNARFLKAFLTRNWVYFHDVTGDVHIFELQEDPLGSINRKKLSFCLENTWLINNPKR
jgi:hypothetical protein